MLEEPPLIVRIRWLVGFVDYSFVHWHRAIGLHRGKVGALVNGDVSAPASHQATYLRLDAQ